MGLMGLLSLNEVSNQEKNDQYIIFKRNVYIWESKLHRCI